GHYDEPEILSYAIPLICSIGADVRHFATQYPGFGRAQSQPEQSLAPPAQTPVTPAVYILTTNVSTGGVSDTSNTPKSVENTLSGFYVGGQLLPAAAQIVGRELKNGRGLPFENGGEDLDTTIGLGFLAGYDWRKQGIPVRTELEYAYRFRHDFESIEVTLGNNITYKDDLSTHSIMLSVFHDFSTSSEWKPYVGAGVGWARNTSSTKRAPAGAAADQTIENSTDNLAYSLQAGLRFELSSQWIGELGYRFINFGEVETGTFSGGDSVSADHHLSHDIILGVAYMY
ncbi:MAG: porin family protein, partial [Rhodospirillales bacterium]|nr:porin family protein [Rhodospirillales bacterium]